MNPKRQLLLPFFLILPAIIFFLIFFALPLISGIQTAFTTPEGELTLANFEKIYGKSFIKAVLNTLSLVAFIIPIQLALALVIALLVNTRLFGSSKFLFICAIPIAISEIVAGIIWLSIFTEKGYLNVMLHTLGFLKQPIIYLSYEEPTTLFMTIALTEIWRATAIVMIIILPGLQMIHKDYFDTADIFGASMLQKLRYVTLPMLKPTIRTSLIIRTVLAFQMFAPVLVLAGRAFPVLASETYRIQFFTRNIHLAAAYALIIMIISTAFVLFYMRSLRTRWSA